MKKQGVIRILREETTAVISIVMIVCSVFIFFSNKEKDVDTDIANINNKIALINKSIETIESNHLTHLQGYAEELLELKKLCDERQKQYLEDKKDNDNERTELLKNLERVITTIELNK